MAITTIQSFVCSDDRTFQDESDALVHESRLEMVQFIKKYCCDSNGNVVIENIVANMSGIDNISRNGDVVAEFREINKRMNPTNDIICNA